VDGRRDHFLAGDRPAPENALQAYVRRGHPWVGDPDPHQRCPVLLAPFDRERIASPDRDRVRIVKAEARTRLDGPVAAKRQEQVRFPAARWRRPLDGGAADGPCRLHALHCRARPPAMQKAHARKKTLHLCIVEGLRSGIACPIRRGRRWPLRN
jgi:hypothetical protein